MTQDPTLKTLAGTEVKQRAILRVTGCGAVKMQYHANIRWFALIFTMQQNFWCCDV